MPFGKATYGASILGFTNANPCVLTVNTTKFYQVGDLARVTNVITSTGSQTFNNDYTITDIGSGTVTIDADATSVGSYVSGGFLTILQQVNAQNTPYLQSNLSVPTQPWVVFNQSIGSQVQSIPYPELIPDSTWTYF